jgi:hypothetical protein
MGEAWKHELDVPQLMHFPWMKDEMDSENSKTCLSLSLPSLPSYPICSVHFCSLKVPLCFKACLPYDMCPILPSEYASVSLQVGIAFVVSFTEPFCLSKNTIESVGVL